MEEYSADMAKRETKETIDKIINSKRLKRRYNRVLNQIHRAAIKGKRECYWAPLRRDVITQAIYNKLCDNEFMVWSRDWCYKIAW